MDLHDRAARQEQPALRLTHSAGQGLGVPDLAHLGRRLIRLADPGVQTLVL